MILCMHVGEPINYHVWKRDITRESPFSHDDETQTVFFNYLITKAENYIHEVELQLVILYETCVTHLFTAPVLNW